MVMIINQMSQFWKDQAVAHELDQDNTSSRKIKQLVQAKQQVLLPVGMNLHWSTINTQNDAELEEVFRFLSDNYLSSDQFKMVYPKQFLTSSLNPPNHHPDLNLGLRDHHGGLVGFIHGQLVGMVIMDEPITTSLINYLCIDKRYRDRLLAPLMIKEITRRVVNHGVQFGFFTATRPSYPPFSRAGYYHRILNFKKAYGVGFCSVDKPENLDRFHKFFSVPPADGTVTGLSRMVESDVDHVTVLLNSWNSRYKLFQQLSTTDVKHLLLDHYGIDCWVTRDQDGKPTDLVSVYYVDNQHLSTGTVLHDAYLLYYTCHQTAPDELFTKLIQTVRSVDVVNMLNIMEAEKIIAGDPKFMVGDGELGYYMFNYRIGWMDPSENGQPVV